MHKENVLSQFNKSYKIHISGQTPLHRNSRRLAVAVKRHKNP
ncbi:MAG: hypothetical protein Q7U64_03370 [Desulfocapsaceae bacterium]|nr:hypothetical protein [Desulfocapsaceae bacterium]